MLLWYKTGKALESSSSNASRDLMDYKNSQKPSEKAKDAITASFALRNYIIPMHDVVPIAVNAAVKMDITTCITVFQVSRFIVLISLVVVTR